MNLGEKIRQFGLQAWILPYYGLLASPRQDEQALIDEMRAGMAQFSQSTPGADTPPEPLWTKFQDDLQNCILTRDPRAFLSWRVVTRTMFTAFSWYAAKELVHLRRRKDWHSRWRAALRESRAGCPAPFPLYPQTSANLIHDAYSLCAFEEFTGLDPEGFDRVLEFGGGYGSMCRLFFNLGFRGSYVIYDLPRCSALQSYYLKSLGIPVLRGQPHNGNHAGALLVCNEQGLALAAPSNRRSRSLFLACWSMSETPLHVRRHLLPFIGEYDGYLIAYQHRFGEVDNCDFFGRWAAETADAIEWQQMRISQIPGEHYYLFGMRRAATAKTSAKSAMTEGLAS